MDEMQLLVAQRPTVDPPSDLVRARARGQLEALFDTAPETTDVRHLRPRAPRRGRRRLVRAVAAGMVAAAIAGLVVTSISGSDSPAAASVLQRAAVTASAQSAPPPGAVLYTRSIGLVSVDSIDDGQMTSSSNVVTTESWIAPDGSACVRSTGDAAPSDERYGPGPCGLAREDFSRWPTTPSAVADKLASGINGPADPAPVEMFSRASDTLRATGAPPAVRAALYRVLAELPGVELLGTTSDHEGRPGTGVAITAHGNRTVLIFDPRTSQVLAEEIVDVANGDLVAWTSYLETSYVDSIPPGGTEIVGTPTADTPGGCTFIQP